MKLVDILARELKEWPEGIDYARQDWDKEIRFHNEVDNNIAHDFYVNTRASDGCDEVTIAGGGARVSRAEWQAAVDALGIPEFPGDAVEWNGEGMPPVGGLYEYNDNFAWCACKVIAYANGKVVFTRPDYPESVYVAGDDEIKFRPIRTPEQIAEEEREKAIAEMADTARKVTGFGIDLGEMAALYDAGYRKQEQK